MFHLGYKKWMLHATVGPYKSAWKFGNILQLHHPLLTFQLLHDCPEFHRKPILYPECWNRAWKQPISGPGVFQILKWKPCRHIRFRPTIPNHPSLSSSLPRHQVSNLETANRNCPKMHRFRSMAISVDNSWSLWLLESLLAGSLGQRPIRHEKT